MARPNDFAQAFAAAHAEAGLTRIPLAPILQRIAAEPGYLFDEDLRRLGGHCPAHPDTRREDYEKIVVNATLAFLYDSLRTHIANSLPLAEDGRLVLPAPPDPPPGPLSGLRPDDAEGLAAVPAETLCAFLRDCSCHMLDALIKEWAVQVLAEEERCRQQGDEITAGAAASFVLTGVLEDSDLYRKPGYDILSITKAGSHTALHACWCLAEAGPLLVPGREDAFYDDLARRSLKQLLPLPTASLGMFVHYMIAAGIEAPDHQATHVLPPDQKAFVYDGEQGVVRLDTGPIAPSAKPGERYYTGCPAFYVTGMIEMYMEIVLAIALEYGVYGRLQERRP